MIPFFAATDYTAPEAFVSWLECLFYFVGFIAAIVLLFRLLFPKENKIPQPLHVKYADRAATHEELVQLRSEFEEFKEKSELQYAEIIAAGDRRRDDINREIRSSVGKVHDRVDLLNSRLGEVVGELKRIHV